MAETKKSDKFEREYVIPLRKKWKHVARYKKTNKAVKSVKEFLVRHMKIRDGDLNKVKLDKLLNEYLWSRGIKNPPSKIKVKATRDGELVKVELSEMPENLKHKKKRFEERNKKAEAVVESKKSTMERLKEAREQKPEKPSETETAEGEAVKEKEEKKAAVVESGMKIEKEAAKMSKKETKSKSDQPKHQRRMALQK